MRSQYTPVKSSKLTSGQTFTRQQGDVPVTRSLDIVNQGSIPYPQEEPVAIEAAPKGRQKARGFGLQMRPNEFLVR